MPASFDQNGLHFVNLTYCKMCDQRYNDTTLASLNELNLNSIKHVSLLMSIDALLH